MTQHPHEEIQGELFGIELESSGTTDAQTPRTVTAHFVETEGGLFPETPAETSPVIDLNQAALSEAIHAEVVERNRRRGNLGKHSPLQREGEEGGSYTSPKVGDYLPDFGPVTYRNFTAAQEHADKLEAQRLARDNR